MTALLSPANIEDLQKEGAVRLALERHAQVPFERITVSVSDGITTLSGKVDWRYQLSATLAAAKTAPGVRDVVNQLTVAFG